MAFNFNWSPLIADTSRAREMLTAALNKSPKPPIIVDDIIVTELNLGSVPPELEILEIGDLAEDRFRGIFKMQYSGDAFMTLKTRVQANPLNTYLSAKPTFASPQPLAAASGLTIPLQITLSDIKLSGFVILVFSRQKGITLVFRNDPLDSLKVSSTFDSIPFVRDYLQQEIEGQLRLLFMEDLPAIIHRLSLRLWSPDHAEHGNINSNPVGLSSDDVDKKHIDPLSSPSQAPRDTAGLPIEDHEPSFSLDDNTTPHASFSHKNLLRLAALTDSHHTLSLFTPPIHDVVYRAWAGAAEGRDSRRSSATRQLQSGLNGAGLTLASLSRHGASDSHSKASSVYSFSSDPGGAGAGSVPSLTSRPTLNSHASTSHAYSTSGVLSNGSRPSTHHRRRKHRVVNLRRPPATAPLPEDGREARRDEGRENDRNSSPSTPTSFSAPGSASWASSSAREGELQTPPDSPDKRADAEATPQARRQIPATRGATAAPSARRAAAAISDAATPSDPHGTRVGASQSLEESQATIRPPLRHRNRTDDPNPHFTSPKTRSRHPGRLEMPIPISFGPSSSSASASTQQRLDEKFPAASPGAGTQPGGILEKAWLMKMAAEIERRVEMEGASRRARGSGDGSGNEAFWNGSGKARAGNEEEQDEAPPAYAA